MKSQKFKGRFSSRRHQLNGNVFNAPVTFSTPGSKAKADGSLLRGPEYSLHSESQANPDKDARLGSQESLSWEGESRKVISSVENLNKTKIASNPSPSKSLAIAKL